ncbi:MAG: hypothetical protein K9K67_09840 [Bacteriovoracaceae bacterium]|nr:hypothetical protein [Bacteriovoracaceae bacterium]
MKFSAYCLILLLLGQTAFAQIVSGPLPVNPQERAFFDYLNRVGSIRFQDNLPVEPWFECDDRLNKRTFFSASMFQFTENNDVEQNIRAWVASFLDHAYWAKVYRAVCRYDVNHFNECRAQGNFMVQFRNQRIIYFQEGLNSQSCDNNTSN